MATDKRGRKLPKGIQQRYDGYEARPMINGKRYLVHGKTIAEAQKQVTDLKYKLEHGLFVEKKNVIHVRCTLKYLDHKGFFEDTPKTRTSKRDIPLTKDTLTILEEQRTFWCFKVVNLDNYLFCNENGEPLSRERVQGEIDRTIKKIHDAGYEFDRITSHVFRHTFATRAIEAGMQPQVLKTILGHSSLAMTMDLYSHVMEDVKVDEMQKIESAF